MRNAFIKTLTELAKKDKRIFLIVGDLGYGVIEDFQKQFPDQFLNAGVAEQNMTGMATGLALSGKIVFTYSIANFPTLRPFEQVRNDICYHNANVKIISIGGGFAYGQLGPTHHATEDLAVMRALPNMTVVAPADPLETELATQAIARRPGPCYMRLNRAGDPAVYQKPPRFSIGTSILIKPGNDVTLIAIGAMMTEALQAATILEKKGTHARVVNMHTLKPLDTKAIIKAAGETKAIITIEEHSIIGGLGSAVAEVLAEHRAQKPFLRIGIPDTFSRFIGDQKFLREKYGLTAKKIAQKAQVLIGQA